MERVLLAYICVSVLTYKTCALKHQSLWNCLGTQGARSTNRAALWAAYLTVRPSHAGISGRVVAVLLMVRPIGFNVTFSSLSLTDSTWSV